MISADIFMRGIGESKEKKIIRSFPRSYCRTFSRVLSHCRRTGRTSLASLPGPLGGRERQQSYLPASAGNNGHVPFFPAGEKPVFPGKRGPKSEELDPDRAGFEQAKRHFHPVAIHILEEGGESVILVDDVLKIPFGSVNFKPQPVGT